MSDANSSFSDVNVRTSSDRATKIKLAERLSLRMLRTHQWMFLLWLLLRKYISRGEKMRRKREGA